MSSTASLIVKKQLVWVVTIESPEDDYKHRYGSLITTYVCSTFKRAEAKMCAHMANCITEMELNGSQIGEDKSAWQIVGEAENDTWDLKDKYKTDWSLLVPILLEHNKGVYIESTNIWSIAPEIVDDDGVYLPFEEEESDQEEESQLNKPSAKKQKI